jgi:hypothetical protein
MSDMPPASTLRTICIALVMLAACTRSPGAMLPTRPGLPTESTTPTPAAQPSPTRLTRTPTAVLSLELAEGSRCPSQPEVSLEALGLPRASHLLVVPADDKARTAWQVLAGDGGLRPFDHRAFSGEPAFAPAISPDQRWLAFYERTASGGDLWVSAADGNRQWIARESLDRPYLTDWATNETMIVFERERGLLGPTTAFRLDPFTKALTPIEPVYLEWNTYAFSPDGEQVIYLQDMPLVFWLYDYRTAETRRVFPWAGGRVTRFYKLAVHWGTNGASVAVMDETGLDLALAMPSSSFQKHTVSIFHLPVEEGRAWYVNWWSADGKRVLLTLGVDDATTETSALSKLHLLDADRQTLYDLCLTAEELSVDSTSTYASADQHFLAWPASKTGALGTVVWEVATGRRAWTPDVRVIGWIELEADGTTAP